MTSNNLCNDTWELTLPLYGMVPFLSTRLKAMIAVGTFVKLEDTGDTIYRIVSYTNSKQNKTSITLNLFDFNTSESYINCSGQERYHQEVIQTDSLVHVSATKIYSVVFVMCPLDFQNPNLIAGDGVINVYLIRFRSDGKDVSDSFVSFPDFSYDYPILERSYPLRIFQDLQKIVDESSRLLNRAAESQGIFARASGSTSVSRVTQQYIRAFLGVTVDETKISTRHLRVSAGMITKIHVRRQKCIFIRCQTELELQQLFKLLGPSALVGNRTRKPRENEPYVPSLGMHYNVIIGSAERDGKFRRRSFSPGFDIVFDPESDLCRIYIRYQRINVGEEEDSKSTILAACASSKLLSLGRKDNHDAYSDATSECSSTKSALLVGTQFMLNKKRYKIVSYCQSLTVARPIGVHNDLNNIRFETPETIQNLRNIVNESLN